MVNKLSRDADISIEKITKIEKLYHADGYKHVLLVLINLQKKFKHDKNGSDVSALDIIDYFKIYTKGLYGLMSRVVLETWGIYTTDDIGTIVDLLCKYKIISKNKNDKSSQFHNVYDFSIFEDY